MIAEKFLDEYLQNNAVPWSPEWDSTYGQLNIAMIEFAKLHVKAALEAAAENAEAFIEYGHGDWMLSMSVEDYGVNKESILNAYPEENIK